MSVFVERILAKTVTTDAGCLTPCRVFMGARTTLGYGRVNVNGKTMLPHRLVYEAEHGAIPDGYEVDHICGVRPCVESDHLQLTTKSENFLAGNHPNAVLARSGKCRRGHDLADNPYVSPSGKRECRVCRQERR